MLLAMPALSLRLVVVGGVSCVLVAVVLSARMALATEARSGASLWRGAARGALVVLISFVVGMTVLSAVAAANGLLLDRDTPADLTLWIALVIFVHFTLFTLPVSLGVGAVAGALFYRLAGNFGSRSQDDGSG